MKHYALIFYSTRTITPEEQKQRPVDIAGWGQQVTEMGIALDPRNFGEAEADFSAPGSGSGSGNGSSDPPMVPIVTIVFFDSVDKDQAVTIARLHPGPRYGVAVKLREWTPPRQSLAARCTMRPLSPRSNSLIAEPITRRLERKDR